MTCPRGRAGHAQPRVMRITAASPANCRAAARSPLPLVLPSPVCHPDAHQPLGTGPRRQPAMLSGDAGKEEQRTRESAAGPAVPGPGVAPGRCAWRRVSVFRVATHVYLTASRILHPLARAARRAYDQAPTRKGASRHAPPPAGVVRAWLSACRPSPPLSGRSSPPKSAHPGARLRGYVASVLPHCPVA